MTTDGEGPGNQSLNAVITEDLAAIFDDIKPVLDKFAGATVLIAGGAGFLPSFVVDALAHANTQLGSDPAHVVCVDNFKTGVPERLAHLDGREDVTFIKHDVTEKLTGVKPDYILHAASIASPTWYRQFPLETIDINVTGTRRLLDLAHESNTQGLLYLSSSEVYGDPPPDKVPTSEDYWGNVSPVGPRACYDESKRLGETLCMTYFRQYGVPIKIVRPFNVYGPRLRLDDGRVMPDLISDALNKRQITLYSNGEVTRSFCYVRDAAVAIIKILAAGGPGEIFNVGNDEEVSIRKLAETVDEVSGNNLGVQLATSEDPEYLSDNPQRRCPDLTKTKAAVDWSPSVSLREGVERMLRFYREGAGV